MTDILHEHFWACWWLIVIVAYLFAKVILEIRLADKKEPK